MKTILIVFQVIILLASLLTGCNSNKNEISIPENEKIQVEAAFADLDEMLKKDNGRLWDYRLEGPILVINRETRFIIANEKDNEGVLKRKGDHFVGRFPDNLIIAHSAIDWNGKRWTMVTTPLPETKSERLSQLIHESFHRIQPEIGFDSLNEMPNIHLDTRDGRIYLKLELEALKKALSSENPEPHLKNALLFRNYRYMVFPEAKTKENSLELNEGLAEYTGTVLCGMTTEELKRHYILRINVLYQTISFVRSFAYFTIPVYGSFMKQIDGQWNTKIDRNTNLTDFINAFYSIEPSPPDSSYILQIGKDYGLDSILIIENARELKRLTMTSNYRTKFLNENNVIISTVNMEIGFNPGEIIPLDTLGAVYPYAEVADKWGKLKVDSGGILVSTKWDKLTFSTPEVISDSIITGSGWKLFPADGWEFIRTENGYTLSERKK